jgi:hypothetical protein
MRNRVQLPQIPWQGLELNEQRGTHHVMTALPVKDRLAARARRALGR